MRMGFLRWYGCGLLCVALLTLAGCGDSGPSRSQVSGTVTFDGQPVSAGEILFLPADGKGPSDAGSIVDGKFTCEVAPGAKKVQISATRESDKPAADGLPNYVNYIPAAYNSETTLTAEVKADGENALTFDLKP